MYINVCVYMRWQVHQRKKTRDLVTGRKDAPCCCCWNCRTMARNCWTNRMNPRTSQMPSLSLSHSCSIERARSQRTRTTTNACWSGRVAGCAKGHEWNGLCQHKQAKRAKWPATNWDKDDTHTHTYTQQQLFCVWNGYVFWIQMPLYADGNASADLNKY